ncbi:MAG: cell division protein SepF, partial [Thermoleophilia bacterium]|nr:cell division protein SepF [Thermoleophilia bacterium]
MGARDYWDRMLVYFGIAEEAYEDESTEYAEEPPARSSARPPRGRAGRTAHPADEFDEAEAPPSRARTAPRRPAAGGPRSRAGLPSQNVAGVGVVPPRTFNDAQGIADQLKRGNPVIVNLQSTDSDLAKRIIDFGSGLTYGLDGSMQRIADKVFLLTPPDVDV